ncbi:hypothetical protein [Puerhibacterium sp. TATVAM-FAB25]|uniref:hypothetical protein n=1 Tax=Puerhibacterium sp. TATVAM-FAB25 TaxID=3093699 RepID=UPI003978EF28
MTHTLARASTTDRLALTLSATAAAAFALVQAFAVAPFVSGDEQAHLDYAYQVWHGRLPVFEEGLALRPEHAWIPEVQWTAQHPPLYYLLLAPLVGPLADAGHPVVALYAGRLLGAVLAALLVVVARWAAAGLTGPRSPLPTVAAFVVACSAVVAQVSGTVFNDLLAALLVTVLLGLVARLVRAGVAWPLVAATATVAGACALTRTSAMITAAVCLLAAGVAGLLHRQVARTAALTLATVVAVVGTAGWFYARNVRLTGNITGGHPEWAAENQGREVRTLPEVLADPETWDRLPNLFWWGPAVPRAWAVDVLVGLPLAVALLGAVVAVVGRRLRGRAPGAASRGRVPGGGRERALRVLLVLLPVAAAGVALGVQLTYATTGGGLYPRYLLPVVLPVALGVAAGLAWAPRRWPVAVLAWAGVVLVDVVQWLRAGEPSAPGAALDRPLETATGYPALTGAAWAAAVAAVVLTAAAACAVVLAVRAARTAGPAGPDGAVTPGRAPARALARSARPAAWPARAARRRALP